MKLTKTLVFALGFLFAPLVILVHECGHFAVYYLQGHHPVLYSSEVDLPSGTTSSWSGHLLSTLGGPMVEASVCVGGFIWLRRRRRGHLEREPSALDWLATCMAMCCGRWIHHTPMVFWSFYRTGHNSSDEVGVSKMLGLPGWVLPVVLWLAAFVGDLLRT